MKEKIKELRNALNLTQTDLAKALGISPKTVSAYESGRANPSGKVLEKLAEIGGKDWVDIIGDAAVKTVKALEKAGVVTEEAAVVAEIEVKKTAKKAGRKAKEAVEKAAVAMEDAAEAATVAEIEVKKTSRKGVRKAKETVEKAAADVKETAAPVAEIAAPIVDALKETLEPVAGKLEEAAVVAEIEVKKNTRSTARKAKEAVEKTVADVKEAAGPVAEMVEEVVKTAGKKTMVSITVESTMGGQITVDEIMDRIPENVESIYIKPEENKAYWVKGDESGDVDLW